MGLLAASNAMATVFGTFLAGPLVEAVDYWVVPLIAIAGVAGAAALMGNRNQEIPRAQTDDGASGSVTEGQPGSNAEPRPPRSSERSGFRREPGTGKH